jgi:dehydrogenase/reductase SDR family member 1
MVNLRGKIAVVTGASRGVGKGIALGLGEAGATVYITGRTAREGDGQGGLPGTIHETAAEVSALGGAGIAVQCDHRDDEQVEELFARVEADHGRLDILVNNVWGGYERMVENGEFTWILPFWQQPVWRWDAMFQAGVRAHYVASHFAATPMTRQRSGLIVSVSFFAAQKFMANTAYGVAKAATDRMIADMAHELREFGVAAVSLYPGLVRTEAVMRDAAFFDLGNSESPQFQGRAVSALASDPEIMRKSGKALISAALALEYSFQDVDGKQPRPVTVEEA